MVVFNESYASGFSRYMNPSDGSTPQFYGDQILKPDIEQPIEPLMKTSDVGATITEGARFGNFIQSAQPYLRSGVSKIELSTQMGGGQEAVGVESYGKEHRQTLREMARASEVEFVSTHTPTQVGNLSGWNPQRGFDENQRKQGLEEVKKAINFAADAAQGGAVVVHTGEYARPISEQEWSRDENGDLRFRGFDEEPGRATFYIVDRRTGEIVPQAGHVRKSQLIREPVYVTADHDYVDEKGVQVRKGDYIDWDHNKVDPFDVNQLTRRLPMWNEDKKQFETRALAWNQIEERADEFNRQNPDKHITPQEMAFRIQKENEMLQYKGTTLYYQAHFEEYSKLRKGLRERLKFYEEVEGRMKPEELEKIKQEDEQLKRMGLAGEKILPSVGIRNQLIDIERHLKHTHEASTSFEVRADEIMDQIKHAATAGDYAKEQSLKSYAEAGIHAWKQTQNNPHVRKDVFVAPENIFPEMGYGSHPEELIELVKKGREKMVEFLTSKKIKDPEMKLNSNGDIQQVENPNFMPGLSRHEAEKLAEKHIKATFDTQHLGMWRQYFVPKPGESKEDTDARFKQWYTEQAKKLADENIIGHIHLVDTIGAGHHHLAMGQGDLPLTDALSYLKKKGYLDKGGSIVSEAHGEESFGHMRIMTETWRALGSPIYRRWAPGMPTALGPQWSGVHHGYFGYTMPPLHIVGSYAPSEDWRFWSQTPME